MIDAQNLFERWAASNDFELDTSGLPDDERRGVDEAKARVLRALESGHAVIDDQDRLVVTPRRGNTNAIVFGEVTGSTLLSMDQRRSDQSIARAFAALASLTREPASRFAAMHQSDLKVMLAALSLFMR